MMVFKIMKSFANNYQPKLFQSLILLCVSALIVGCPSSGSSGPDVPPGPSDDEPGNTTLTTSSPYQRSGVNGTLQGEIWSASSGSRLNLNTGEVKYLSEHDIYPSSDGREYVELVKDYGFYSNEGCGGWPIDSDAIFIRDSATETTRHFFESLRRLSGPVFFSPDGQTLALYASNGDVCDDYDLYATLMTRDGEVIATGSERVVGFDWMPDNRLAFMVNDDGVYKLAIGNESNSFNGFVTATLPDLEGSASRFRLSPDGTQVLIEVVTRVPPVLSGVAYREATIWQMDIDGSNLRKLVDTSRLSSSGGGGFDEPRVNQPVWSPDSEHVLVTENYTSGAAVTFYGTETENMTYIESVSVVPVNRPDASYIIPANSELQRLPPASYSPTGVRPLLSNNEAGQAGVVGLTPIKRQTWTPVVGQSVTSIGGFPKPNGIANRGLTGNVYVDAYVFANDAPDVPITRVNLATNEKSIIGLDVNSGVDSLRGFDVSPGGERIVALHYENTDTSWLNLYDGAGSRLKSYVQANDNYDYTARGGLIRFSPVDEEVVAWLFRSDGFGGFEESQGIVVLNSVTAKFVEIIDDVDYDGFDWMPNGDLLLVDANKVYLAKADTNGFANPVLLFEHIENLKNVQVRPDGSRLVFSSAGRIYTIDINGSTLVNVTAPSTHHYSYPVWSPDGQTIGFRGTKHGPVGSEANYFVSADAKNVALYSNYIQDGIMKIGESTNPDHRIDEPRRWR